MSNESENKEKEKTKIICNVCGSDLKVEYNEGYYAYMLIDSTGKSYDASNVNNDVSIDISCSADARHDIDSEIDSAVRDLDLYDWI